MTIVLPKEVKTIIQTLKEAGFDSYAVGGCVRDSLLGHTPKDWDITTNAKPMEIKALFPVTIDTGIEHGTVTVRLNKKSFEVTTYRSDGKYLDGRHPQKVTFVPDLKEDLRRRDFTINAMAYSEDKGLVDVFGGMEDLENKIIRCVEEPLQRFDEDALRMMRAVRFKAQLDFSIEEKTQKAIIKLAEKIQMVSQERITDELIKLICSNHPEAMLDLSQLGLSQYFFPEWDRMLKTSQNTKHHRANVGEHTVFVMKGVSPTKSMRLSALLHDVAKPICKKTDVHGADHFVGHPQVGEALAKEILRRFKMDNNTIDYVCRMIRFHDERPPVKKRAIRRCLSRMGEDILPEIFELMKADISGQSDYMQQEKLDRLNGFIELYEEIKKDGEAMDIKSLCIDGKAIMDLGVPSGPRIGDILKALLSDVLDYPDHNNTEYLIQKVKKMIDE